MIRPWPVACAALLAGCFPTSSYQCDLDTECSGGEVCARSHECLPAGQVRPLRLRWTIDGVTDTAAECPARQIGDLTVEFSAADGSDLAFSPVPCGGGAYYIDKLPVRFDQATIAGYDPTGVRYAGVVAIGGDPEYTVALVPE